MSKQHDEEGKYSQEDQVKKFVQNQEIEESQGKDLNQKSDKEEIIGSPIQDTTGVNLPWQKKADQISMGNEIGHQQINLKDLPTQGLFYPDGTEIIIRAALAGEIRHWSTLDEKDLSALDDMLNFILQRCATVKFPGGQHSSWKDLKEVDRFYVILAIHEYTFIKGENKLQVKTSETKKMDVRKEMIDYVELPEEIMRFYDPDERCFVINLNDGAPPFKCTLPSVGVTNWLKNYLMRMRQQQNVIDEDFISFAPFVILDWRGLGDKAYEQYLYEAEKWSIAKISALSWIKDKFVDAVEPVIRYQDENGGERQVPLNFQGGVKSLFLISNPFGQLG